MSEEAGLSALRERVGRTEVEVVHQAEKLRGHDQRLDQGSRRIADLDKRLENLERLLRVMHQATRWGLASVGTMTLEAMTGALRSVIKMLTSIGNGS